MCARFENTAPPLTLLHRFGLTVPPVRVPGPVIRPTNPALVIGPGGRTSVLPWGLTVAWDTRPLINARSETLTRRATFRPLVNRRCLIPATAWFEWRKEGQARHRNRFVPADNAPFALAGLVDDQAFVLLTTAASPDAAAVHDRMPVVLPRDAEAAWLDPVLTIDALAGILAPYPGRLQITEDDDRQPDLFR